MMTENPIPDKENIIKDIINLFKTKKEKKQTAITNTRNFLKLEKKKLKQLKTEYLEIKHSQISY